MNLNRFLKADREKAERLFISTRDLMRNCLPRSRNMILKDV
nr:YqaH family protein [Bacillus licheniformis]